MAKKPKDDSAKTEGEEVMKSKRGKKTIIIPVVILLLGLGGGGYFFMSGSKSTKADPHATTTVAEGPIVRLSPITMNLSDGHVLKVGMALETVAKPKDKHLAAALAAQAGHEGSSSSSSENTSPLAGQESLALDQAIRTLGDSTFDNLSKPGGKEQAKEALSKEVKDLYHGDVTGVLFTDFVMS